MMSRDTKTSQSAEAVQMFNTLLSRAEGRIPSRQIFGSVHSAAVSGDAQTIVAGFVDDAARMFTDETSRQQIAEIRANLSEIAAGFTPVENEAGQVVGLLPNVITF